MFACENSTKEVDTASEGSTKVQPTIGAKVKITTDMGDIVIGLYNETPQHRDNFVKLVEEGFYDSLIFHRVINQFMVQGGDPESKNATPEQMLGNGGPGYQIPAEIVDGIIHKKGALAAARTSDQMNPERQSSGSQFYIVQGRAADSATLAGVEQRISYDLEGKIFKEMYNETTNVEVFNKMNECRANKDREGFTELMTNTIQPAVKAELAKRGAFKYTAEQFNTYATVGGTPHLDMQYTVFGEVIEGLDIIDQIAAVKTQKGDRPEQDIRMFMEVIK
ncbi:MAG: peptidylprolyl isomerase [Bacteroidales bacterium]|nr:peptidylprolyl isomerase [Bacteroidales bacterium]